MRQKLLIIPLILLGVLACYPVLFLASGSLMGNPELLENLQPALKDGTGYALWTLLPLTPTLRHYVELLLDSPEFFLMFWNSVKMTLGILLGKLVVSTMAAWGFAKFRFPLKKALFTLYILLMILPFQATMLSSYLVLNKISLVDTIWAVVLPGIFSTFPVFLIFRFFNSIPDVMLEAAKIDGAGQIAVFIHIGLPLGSSGIVSAMVLGFLEYWNLIEQPLTFLKTKLLWPLSLYLPQISLEQAGISFSASIVTLLPALFVFLWGQDYLESGIIAAAIKE